MLDEHAIVVHSNRAFRLLMGLDAPALDGRAAATLGLIDEAGSAPQWARWLNGALAALSLGGSAVSPALSLDATPASGRSPRTRHVELHLAHVRIGAAGRRYYTVRAEDVTDHLTTRLEDARARALLRSKAQLRQVKFDEAEARLNETRDRLEQALAFAHIGTWELDFATGMIACSLQCRQNMGLDADAVITESRLVGEIIHPDDREGVRRHIGEVVENGAPYLAEYRITTVPGRWILAGGRVRLGANRQPVGMVGFTLDITDRKRSELEQSALAKTERTGRESSERYAQALDHFVSSVSHELRTPIGVILNWAQLLEIGGERFDVSRVVPVLKRNARHLALMVDDLLDSGAIVSGNLAIRKHRLRLDAAIDEIATDLLGEATNKGLDLQFPDLPEAWVEADEARIRQIFWNLLTNAIKFSDSGTITIDLQIADGFAVCRVRDEGMGLPGARLDVIFERFKQLDTSRPTPSKGLGLGLWLVRNLVEQHGGSIAAESAGANLGSTFTVRIPLAQPS